MSFLKNRIASLCVIVFVYALAVIVSIFIYPALNMSFWKALLVTDVVATVIVFIFSNIFRNASVYDPYWSIIPPIVCIYLMIHYHAYSFMHILFIFNYKLLKIVNI